MARNFDDLVIQSRNKSCFFAETREITAKHLCQIRKQSIAEVDILSLKPVLMESNQQMHKKSKYCFLNFVHSILTDATKLE